MNPAIADFAIRVIEACGCVFLNACVWVVAERLMQVRPLTAKESALANGYGFTCGLIWAAFMFR